MKQNKITTIKLWPHFESKIWANDNISKFFNINEKSIGEAWLISCFEDKSSLIINLNNTTLYDFYNNKDNAYFFNSYNLLHPLYPLLAKLIDAKEDLSIQIHPDNEYANKKHQSLGKAECWYILNTPKNNQIILGHKANTLDEFKQMVKNNLWNKYLKLQTINNGDFIYVDAKKIHAIKANTFLYELQQSSDITYRVYDYNRLENGKLRHLHLDDVYNLINCPDKNLEKSQISDKEEYLVANDVFHLKLIENIDTQTYKFDQALWCQLSIIEGEAIINDIQGKTFDSFLIAYQQPIVINGKCKCLISFITK